MTKIELESRGPLSAQDVKRLMTLFEKDGKFITKKNRLHVCYSNVEHLKDPSTHSELDIRAKITNGAPEMVIKIGKWGASEGREEITVELKKGQFPNLLRAYAALGFHKGLIAIRNSHVYTYQDIEFALVEVPGHSWFFEAEMIVHKKDIETARDRINQVCLSLGLKIFTDKEFWSYVDTLNKSANIKWDFAKDGLGTFSKYGLDK